MIGTYTHGDIPQMFHPLYINSEGIRIPIPLPSNQEKMLSCPSLDVSRAISMENVKRKQEKRKEDEEQKKEDISA
jgi:hypothetical protein